MKFATGLGCLILAAAMPLQAQTTAPVPPRPPVVPSIANPMVPHAAFVPLDNGATQGYNEAMSRMMAGMNKLYSGNADRDFAVHMIPHHQGAIDMAEVELKFGSDPKVKQLAARIIAAQQREIAQMETWLAKHPLPGGSPPAKSNAQWK